MSKANRLELDRVVPPVVPYKALGKFPKAFNGTTEGTCSAQFFGPVMSISALLGCKGLRT